MSEIYHGYTQELPAWQKRKNLLTTLRQLVKDHPDNEYWKARLEATEQQFEREEIEADNEWLGVQVAQYSRTERDLDEWQADWEATYRSLLP